MVRTFFDPFGSYVDGIKERQQFDVNANEERRRQQGFDMDQRRAEQDYGFRSQLNPLQLQQLSLANADRELRNSIEQVYGMDDRRLGNETLQQRLRGLNLDNRFAEQNMPAMLQRSLLDNSRVRSDIGRTGLLNEMAIRENDARVAQARALINMYSSPQQQTGFGGIFSGPFSEPNQQEDDPFGGLE